jgi:hypothetical protein
MTAPNENNSGNNERSWSITIGLYPGILFGYRAYEEVDFITYVIYLPLIDIAIEIDKY